MEILPSHLFYDIFLFLDTQELFESVLYVNKESANIVQSDTFIQDLVRRDLYIHKTVELDGSSCLRLLRTIRFTNNAEDLDFVGYSTDGGISGDSAAY